MAFNVNEIKSQLILGGARNNLFQVTIQNPANSVADIRVPFMVRATSIPEATVGVMEVPYFGRRIRLAGDRKYGNWSVTVINDEDYLIRNAMEEWSNRIQSFEGNVRAFGSASPLLYKAQAQVVHYSKTGVPIRTYQFNGIFPVDISGMGMDWAQQDQIQEFSVRFAYDFWQVSGGITGNAGGT